VSDQRSAVGGRDIMSYWRNKRVLVTGGAGFIGSNLVARLVKEGAQVRVVDNLERGRLEYLAPVLDYIEFRQEDLRDPDVCRRACEGMEVVFHLASKVGGIGYYLNRPAEVLIQNVLIDTFMLEAVRAAAVERYFYASSAHVYPIELQGTPDAPLIREEQAIPAHPELSYGWAKLLGEKQIEYAVVQGEPLRAAIVRLIGVYGPNQDLDLATGSAIPVFIRRAIEYPDRQPFIVLGTGEETRSYCFIDDVLDAMLLCVEKLNDHQLLGPLNVGSQDRIRIGDLARMIIEISGKDIPITYDSSHKTVIWGQALDCSKARKLLNGWQPKVSLREGLERTYAHIETRLRGR
jgi:GDP-D-mannose 3',5'-epimerase